MIEQCPRRSPLFSRIRPITETVTPAPLSVQELRRQASADDSPANFFHFRDKDGLEVDVVIERGIQAVAGVEVKAAASVTAADFRGLRKLKEAAGKRFAGDVVLYDGEVCAGFGEGLHAVPLGALWGDA